MKRLRHLEGLRGYAALIVVLSHCAMAFWPALHGVKVPDPIPAWQSLIFNSPFTFIYNGTVSVYIFFVLSGYVLSVAFFATGDDESVREKLVRRYFRLAIPIVTSCLLCFAVWKIGGFNYVDSALPDWIKRFYRPDAALTLPGVFREGLVDSFLYGKGNYNYVLWTMRIEFFGSILVFANCLLLKGIRFRSAAYLIQAVVGIYMLKAEEWFYICFFAGMVIADYRNLVVRWPVSVAMLVVAVYLGGFHNTSLSYAFLGRSGSTGNFCYTVSACLFLFAALNNNIVIRTLSTKLSDFLGSISFMLYLTHSVVLSSIGMISFLNLHPVLGYGTAGLVSSIVTVTVSIAVAFMFRPVDRFAIELSRQFGLALMSKRQQIVFTPESASAP
ncbi:acyltransferase [Phyllobacterium sp. SB3]|uniref:acyltransferase family protein n=1 Tax=Phyllobacterium sp. SB3 TaxID=3156073 RepID=UPI0032AF667F